MKVSPLPEDSAGRKEIPMLSGFLNYFPAACAWVARISKRGNDKHNPGEPLHHVRGKSMDHGDCIIRHTVDVEAWKAYLKRFDQFVSSAEDRNKAIDVLLEEAAYRAWRSLAELQELCEEFESAPLAPGARVSCRDPKPPYDRSFPAGLCLADLGGGYHCSRAKAHRGGCAAHEAHVLTTPPICVKGIEGVFALRDGEFRSHRGIAGDWHFTCTDNDCWCWGSEHHNLHEK